MLHPFSGLQYKITALLKIAIAHDILQRRKTTCLCTYCISLKTNLWLLLQNL